MSNVRVMHENYVDPDYYVSMTYSTQKTVAPAENVLNYVRRSKVWRTDGYWEITASNKTIIFRETVGVDLTATIAESNYTSDSSFLTAIKTALEAVGDSTYTVTRDTSTNKIKITSNGSGGGGVFQLICTSGSFTSASILGFSTASNLTGALTYTADTLKIHTSEWMKWDMGTSVNPKAFVLIGLRNTPIKISETATIKLQGNHTDTWSSPVYDQTLSYHSDAIAVFSTTGLHTEALRYWRLVIQDPGNLNGYIEISNLYLGDAITTTRGAVQFPLRESVIDLSQTAYSQSGVSFSDENEMTSEISFGWNFLTVTEAEVLKTMIKEVGTSKPFFVCLDPEENFSSNLETQVRFVKFTGKVNIDLTRVGIFSSDWDLREEL